MLRFVLNSVMKRTNVSAQQHLRQGTQSKTQKAAHMILILEIANCKKETDFGCQAVLVLVVLKYNSVCPNLKNSTEKTRTTKGSKFTMSLIL